MTKSQFRSVQLKQFTLLGAWNKTLGLPRYRKKNLHDSLYIFLRLGDQFNISAKNRIFKRKLAKTPFLEQFNIRYLLALTMVVKMFILFLNNFHFTENDRKLSFQFIGFMYIRTK